MKRKSNINFISIAVLILLVLSCIAFYVIFPLVKKANQNGEKIVAKVSINGKQAMKIVLNDENDKIIDLSKGYSVPVQLEIKDKKIRFINVDCPDKICEKYGFIGENFDTAVCLPNKTIVKISLEE